MSRRLIFLCTPIIHQLCCMPKPMLCDLWTAGPHARHSKLSLTLWALQQFGSIWSYTGQFNWQVFPSHYHYLIRCAQAEAAEARKLQKGGSPAPKAIPADPFTAQRTSSLQERSLAIQAVGRASSDAEMPPINGSTGGNPAAHKITCMVAMLDEAACASPHIPLPELVPITLKGPCRTPGGGSVQECDHRAASIHLPSDPPHSGISSEPRCLTAALNEAAQPGSQLAARQPSKLASELQCFGTVTVGAARSSPCMCLAIEATPGFIHDAGSMADSNHRQPATDNSHAATLLSSKMVPTSTSETAMEISLKPSASLERSDCRLGQPGTPNGDLKSSSKKHETAYLDWSQNHPLQMPMPASGLPSSETKSLSTDRATTVPDGQEADIHVPSSIKVPSYRRINLANVEAEQLQCNVAVDSSDERLVVAEIQPLQHGKHAAPGPQISCGRRRSLSPLKQAIRQHLSSGKQMTRKLSGSSKPSGPLTQDATPSDSSDADVSACWLDLPQGVAERSSQIKHCKCCPRSKQSLYVGQVSEYITQADGKLSPGQQKRYRAFRDSPTCIDCCHRGAPQRTTHRCRGCCTAASLSFAYHSRSR